MFIVWGLIGYMIIAGIDSDMPEAPKQNQNLVFSPKTNKEVDTFSIQNIIRDPFLGTLTSKKKYTNKTPKHKNFNTKNLNIAYKGLIQRQNSSEKVFAVHIENTEYLLKKGQVISKVKLISGNGKSIKILYNNSYQTIKRQ